MSVGELVASGIGGGGGKRRGGYKACAEGDSPARQAWAAVKAGQLSQEQLEAQRDRIVRMSCCSWRWGQDVWYEGIEYPPGGPCHTEMVFCRCCRRYYPPQASRMTLRRYVVRDARKHPVLGLYASGAADALQQARRLSLRWAGGMGGAIDVAHVHSDGICDCCSVERMALDLLLAMPSQTSVATIYQVHSADRRKVRDTRRLPGDLPMPQRRSQRRRFRADPGGGRSPAAEAWASYRNGGESEAG